MKNSRVDESSEPSKIAGRREFSGRREFCPLVDESSVLKVDESSVFDGRREFMDPKLTTPQYFYHYSMHIMVLAFVLLTVSRVAYYVGVHLRLTSYAIAYAPSAQWLVDRILIVITWTTFRK